MSDMPRHDRWPRLNCAKTRHGKTVWYVRLPGPAKSRQRVRLKAAFGTPEFETEYRAALGITPATPPKRSGPGTFAWAELLYRQSIAWTSLSIATRRQRENILRHVVTAIGDVPLRDISRADIVGNRDDRSDRPAAARHFVETMRGFFAWALDADLVSADPTQGVKTPKRKTEGHPPWTDDDCRRFEARWDATTRERLAYAVLLFTGLRRGDAVVLGRPHVRDGIARLRTEKTGEWVAIRIAPELQTILDTGPCGELTFIAGARGKPMVKESFGTWFREVCRAAGITKSAHGLRKAAATRAANNGATESELEAMFGWRGGRMASLYTRAMDRERLAIGAGEKLERRTALGAPEGVVGRTLKKGA